MASDVLLFERKISRRHVSHFMTCSRIMTSQFENLPPDSVDRPVAIKFITECPHCKHDVNYTKTVLCGCLTCELAYQDIQLDMMGDGNQNQNASSSYGKHKKDNLISKHDNASRSIDKSDSCLYFANKSKDME